MSKDPIIDVNSLSKIYKLYGSHRDRIKEAIHPLRKSYHQKYHALKEVSISVEKGEVLGIIGKNGSGKSTLLKILASVVTPTSGDFNCKGKVTALLELGGGFNKDLSGIENIYFLGGIQGYSRKEMQQRLAKILDFAEIGVYANQPVNSYSSGMYVRLAFSMAINIDPDILIIDEALSVGDIRFQQKCFRKIREFKDAGKTMLICTHSLGAVRDFCSRAIWLHEGKVMEQGDPIFVTESYSSFMTAITPSALNRKQNKIGIQSNNGTIGIDKPKNSTGIDWNNVNECDSYGAGGAVIQGLALYNAETNQKLSVLNGGEKIRIYIQMVITKQLQNPGIQLVVNGRFGMPVLKITNYLYNQRLSIEISKPTVVAVDFKFPLMGNGHYSISAGILNIFQGIRSELHWVHDAIITEVANQDVKHKLGTQLVLENVSFQVLNEIESPVFAEKSEIKNL